MQRDFVAPGEPTAPPSREETNGVLVVEAYAEIGLIEQALRHGRTAAVAAAAGRLARASMWAGACRAAAIATDLERRARAGDLTIAAHLLASIEEALTEATAAPARPDRPAPRPPARPSAPPPAPAPRAPVAPAPARCASPAPTVVLAEAPAALGWRPSVILAAATVGFGVLVARSFSPGHVSAMAAAVAVALTAGALARLGRSVGEHSRTAAALARSRERLEASERQHRLLFERSPQPLWVYERETLRIVAVSDAAVAVYGYSREEFLAMTITELRPPEDVAPLLGYLEVAAGPEQLGTSPLRPWRHRYKDGTIVEVEVTSDALLLDGRECRIVLCRDVTERNAESIEAAVARDAAIEASRVTSAFLANMSHEIRTPMNGVVGMNELLLETDLDDEQRYLAEQVASSSEQMVAIIEDILDIARIESGRLELDEADFDLVSFLNDVCRVAAARAATKGLELERRIDDELPRFVHGDEQRLRRVLSSLISNAVKFTPAGSVAVRATARHDRAAGVAALRVEIADTGLGIERRRLERMFDPFVQADMTTTRCYGGAGLGLAIARELIELMGGTIGARSEPDVGSTFWVEVKLAVVARLRPREATPPLPPTELDHDRGGGTALVLVADDGPAVVVARRSGTFRDRRERRARAGRGSARERWGVHVGGTKPT